MTPSPAATAEDEGSNAGGALGARRDRAEAPPQVAVTPALGTPDTGVASPSIRRVLPLHVLAIVLMQSTSTCVGHLLPVIAKKEFHAGDFQTTIVTAAPNVLALVSIFWGAWFGRTRLGLYALAYFTLAYVPLAFWALGTSYWVIAVLAVLAALGSAGYTPLAASLLERYPARIRGKIFAVVLATMFLMAALGSKGLGHWMKADPQAFRVFLPMATAVQGLGLVCVLALLRGRRSVAAAHAAPSTDPARRFWARVAFVLHPGGLSRTALVGGWRAITHMNQVLKGDRIFARYEAAFMTYGIGWMIGWALVPLMVTERLNLDYDEITGDWSFALMVTSAIVTLPAGYLVDRLGAMRTCMIAFGLYAAWPVILIFTTSTHWLLAGSIVFGVASSLVNMGWMLGPVSLAPSRDKVPQYIAIHTTMVGLRGTVGQFAGVAVYKLSGDFVVPLVIAACSFAWASWQMRSLHRLQHSLKTNQDAIAS